MKFEITDKGRNAVAAGGRTVFTLLGYNPTGAWDVAVAGSAWRYIQTGELVVTDEPITAAGLAGLAELLRSELIEAVR